jgi:hypothetical protein
MFETGSLCQPFPPCVSHGDTFDVIAGCEGKASDGVREKSTGSNDLIRGGASLTISSGVPQIIAASVV